MAIDVPFLIARVRSRIQITDTATLSDAEILEWINGAQERMVQLGTEWRAIEQEWDTTYASTDNGKLLPANLTRVYGVWQLDTAQTDPTLQLIEIPNVTRRQWISRVNAPDTSRQFPRPSLKGTWHYFWANKLYVVGDLGSLTSPLQIRVDYYGVPPDLTATGAGSVNYFTERYPRVLKWGTYAEGYEWLEQPDLAAYAEQKFLALLDRARTFEKQLQAGGGPHQRGV